MRKNFQAATVDLSGSLAETIKKKKKKNDPIDPLRIPCAPSAGEKKRFPRASVRTRFQRFGSSSWKNAFPPPGFASPHLSSVFRHNPSERGDEEGEEKNKLEEMSTIREIEKEREERGGGKRAQH